MLQHDWLLAVALRHDRDQAAENEGTAVLLDSVGSHQIHLAAEQRFQAIGQMDEADADRLGEVRQQIHVAAGGGLIRGEGAEKLQAAEHELSGQAWELLAQHRQHLGATGAGVGDGGRHGSGGADGGILGAMSGNPRTRVQSSPLKACCRMDFFRSSRPTSLRS